ncbi:MAG: PD-(D/E)XK nuclease family protein [Polynucleobacter sp.]|nr:PD-(D/E)XK nuclease family protein [Polynucleobacter sp.]
MKTPAAFPTIPLRETPGSGQPLAWSVPPDRNALEALSGGIWNVAKQTGQRPLVVLSTAGPLMALRSNLEQHRPADIAPQIAFLPEVMSLSDWLGSAPQSWTFPKAQTPLERWLAVYAALQAHPKLRAWFKAESEAGAWGLAQAIIAACDTLSSAVLSQSASLMTPQQGAVSSDAWLSLLQKLLEEAIEEAYPTLARKVVDREAEVLLLFWRYLSDAGNPIVRKHLALAAYLQAGKQAQHARPFVWVQTADGLASDRTVMQRFMNEYAAHAPVIDISLNWGSVGLWPEALSAGVPEASQAKQDAIHNAKSAYRGQWRLLSANRFEELAWMAAKSVEEHIIAGKKNIALVAQDRLAARRTRALLARFGPALAIRDETGWKLSTTRAAAALHSWLTLIRAPKEGPSAADLLEFLQNPFVDIPAILEKDPQDCNSLIAELEDRLIASQAHSGWESFYIAMEGVRYGTVFRQAPANPLLLELLQFVRGRTVQWRSKNVDVSQAYQQLHSDITAFGMATTLAEDSAGKQLLDVLLTLELPLQPNSIKSIQLRLSEWISLLSSAIEDASYQEVSKQAHANLSILPLSSTRLREFDAVVMVGCDENQLPAFSEPPLFFSEALNRLLHGSTIEHEFKQQARDLSQLLVSCPAVDLLWQSKSANGEPIRAAAWIQRLQMALPEWKMEGQDTSPGSVKRAGISVRMDGASATPNAALPLPLSMSPSAYRTLRDCPYRYYVRSLLGLRKQHGFDEGIDASLAGQTIHAVLHQFFRALKTHEQTDLAAIAYGSDARRSWMTQHLNQASERIFARFIEGDERVLGVLRDWQKQIPSFIEWQLQREAAGWRYLDGEIHVGFDLPFTSEDGELRMMRIEGYVDRIDAHIDSASAAVLDYKHQTVKKVRDRAASVLDDPQLLIYARAVTDADSHVPMQGRAVTDAEWVALKTELKNGNSSAERSVAVADLADTAIQSMAQITEDVELLWARKTLNAFAPDSVCRYCESRGICRKGMW